MGNGGTAFNTTSIPAPASDYAPNVLVFSNMNPSYGLAAAGLGTSATAYAAYTTTGPGGFQSSSPLHTTAQGDLTFNSAFYAATDPTHVWLVGSIALSNGNSQPILLASSNGGKDFTDISQAITNVDITDNWVTGFALDDVHIWLGSATGNLLYSAIGGN
jgi:hypothetical protein